MTDLSWKPIASLVRTPGTRFLGGNISQGDWYSYETRINQDGVFTDQWADVMDDPMYNTHWLCVIPPLLSET